MVNTLDSNGNIVIPGTPRLAVSFAVTVTPSIDSKGKVVLAVTAPSFSAPDNVKYTCPGPQAKQGYYSVIVQGSIAKSPKLTGKEKVLWTIDPKLPGSREITDRPRVAVINRGSVKEIMERFAKDWRGSDGRNGARPSMPGAPTMAELQKILDETRSA